MRKGESLRVQPVVLKDSDRYKPWIDKSSNILKKNKSEQWSLNTLYCLVLSISSLKSSHNWHLILMLISSSYQDPILMLLHHLQKVKMIWYFNFTLRLLTRLSTLKSSISSKKLLVMCHGACVCSDMLALSKVYSHLTSSYYGYPLLQIVFTQIQTFTSNNCTFSYSVLSREIKLIKVNWMNCLKKENDYLLKTMKHCWNSTKWGIEDRLINHN